MKSISGFSGVGMGFGAAGRQETAADGAGGAKTRRESRLMDSPPFPRITGFIIPSFWIRWGRHLWSMFWTIHQRRGWATQRHHKCLNKINLKLILFLNVYYNLGNIFNLIWLINEVICQQAAISIQFIKLSQLTSSVKLLLTHWIRALICYIRLKTINLIKQKSLLSPQRS